ncbi:tetratricopeptide repeat protein [Micromonospora sp. MS34]|uniref:tetratricopeptide repeat protein n=1 Tax=Micromonospora sp. MS34 TaxID=3385971 RepID=UPI00399F5A7E
MLELGRWREAIAELGTVVADHPGDVEALCLLARCYSLAGDPASTVATAERVLAVAPRHEWALRQRAVALAALKHRRAAAESARAAIVAAPTEWRAHAALAEVQVQRLGAWSVLSARLAADAALRLAPEEADAHLVDARVRLRTGELTAARRACLRALELDPGNQVALHNLAVVELTRERPDRAARGFTEVLAGRPDDRLVGTAHRRVVHAMLWRLFDVFAAATLLHVALFTVLAGPWRRPVALATALALLAGLTLVGVRAWRAQPAPVRWRLRSDRLRPAVMLWPAMVAAAALTLLLSAYRPAPGGVAERMWWAALLVTLVGFGARLVELLGRRVLILLVRLSFRATLGLYRAGVALRRRRVPAAAARARG